MPSTVSISAIGLTHQENTVLGVAVNLLSAFEVAVHLLPAGDAGGHIAVVNSESDAGRHYVPAPFQKQLVLAEREGRGDNRQYLLKPIRVQALKDALLELIAAAAPAANDRPAAAKQARGTPLFYSLVDAIIEHRLVRLKGSGIQLMVHGPSRSLYAQAAVADLVTLIEGGGGVQADTLGEADFMQACRGAREVKLQDLLWTAARHGGVGELRPGHSLEQRVRLTLWPRFAPRDSKPEYLRLSAALTAQPMTLQQAADRCAAPLPLVLDFFNAALALGIVEVSAAPVAPPPAPKKPSGQRAGLLAMIARRLAFR